jgi:vitamin B12 transporter
MRRMLLSFALLATPAFAQDIPIPERVVTATRIPSLIEAIPAGVSLITRETIETRGYTTLVDALAAVPGIGIVQSGGPGGNASVFIRGSNSNHVLVLRDGIPVNDPSTPGNSFNFGTETLADVERIEIVRGPMSSLYGSGATAGVINLISRTGKGPVSGTIELATGLPRQLLANGTLSGKTGKFDYALQAGTQSSVGFDTTPRRESIYTGSRNGFSAQTASATIGVTPIEGTRFFASLRGRQSKFNLDDLGYDASQYRGTDNTFTGRVGVTSELFDGLVDTSLVLAATRTDRRYVHLLESADPNQSQSNDKYRATRTTIQWNNTLHLPDAGPATSNALTFGYEHALDSVRVTQDSTSFGYPYSQTTRASAASDAGNIGLQTTIWNRLTLTANARAEEGRYGGGAFTWRAGGVLATPEILSRFKASTGTAFRAPSLYDLFGTDSYNFRGNPNLKPERSTGYELGWAIDIPALGQPNAATIDITYFNNRIRDLITFQYAPDFSSSTEVNIARARTEGVEFALTLRPAKWLETTLSTTHTEARNATNNQRLLRRPKNRASLTATITPIPGLNISPEIIYAGAAQDFLIDNDGNSTRVGRAKGGTIANLTITYALTDQITLFTTGKNIGGSKYEAAQGFQTPGPSVLAGVRARF